MPVIWQQVVLKSHMFDYGNQVQHKYVSIIVQGIKTLMMVLLWFCHDHHGHTVLQSWSFCLLCLLLTSWKCLFPVHLCRIHVHSVLVNLGLGSLFVNIIITIIMLFVQYAGVIVVGLVSSSIEKGGGIVVCKYYITYVRYIIFYWYKIHCLLTAFFLLFSNIIFPFYIQMNHIKYMYTHTHTYTYTKVSQSIITKQGGRWYNCIPSHTIIMFFIICQYDVVRIYTYVYYYDVVKWIECMYLSSSLLVLNLFEPAAVLTYNNFIKHY